MITIYYYAWAEPVIVSKHSFENLRALSAIGSCSEKGYKRHGFLESAEDRKSPDSRKLYIARELYAASRPFSRACCHLLPGFPTGNWDGGRRESASSAPATEPPGGTKRERKTLGLASSPSPCRG